VKRYKNEARPQPREDLTFKRDVRASPLPLAGRGDEPDSFKLERVLARYGFSGGRSYYARQACLISAFSPASRGKGPLLGWDPKIAEISVFLYIKKARPQPREDAGRTSGPDSFKRVLARLFKRTLVHEMVNFRIKGIGT